MNRLLVPSFVLSFMMLGGLVFVSVPAVFDTGAVAYAAPAEEKPKPPKAKDMRKLAGECVVAGMASGAYQSLAARDLATYCVEASKAVFDAEYE